MSFSNSIVRYLYARCSRSITWVGDGEERANFSAIVYL